MRKWLWPIFVLLCMQPLLEGKEIHEKRQLGYADLGCDLNLDTPPPPHGAQPLHGAKSCML